MDLIINHIKDILDYIADFLEIELDIIRIQARLSLEKLERAKRTVIDLLKRSTIPHHELELAVEFLFFTAKVVVSKRAFLRRLFDAIRRPMAIVRLTTAMKADLQ